MGNPAKSAHISPIEKSVIDFPLRTLKESNLHLHDSQMFHHRNVSECREGKPLPGITPLKKFLLATVTGLEPVPFCLTTRDSTFELDGRMSGGKIPPRHYTPQKTLFGDRHGTRTRTLLLDNQKFHL